MKNYFILILLFFTFISNAQKLSITDSIDLYNGLSITKDSDTIKLPAPNYERALELSKIIQYKEGECEAILNLGRQAIHNGDLENSLKKFQQAYTIAEDLNDPAKKSNSLANIGVVHVELGHYEMAINYYKEAREIFTQQDDKLKVGSMLSNMAAAFIRLEKGDSAMVYLNQALDIFEEYGNQRGVVYVLNNMGVYYLEKEQSEKALLYFKQIIGKDIIDSDLLMKGSTYMNMGSAYGALKDYDIAEEYFFKALEIDQKNNFRNKEFIVYDALAYLYKKTGDYKKAFEYQQKHYLLKDSIIGAINQERIAELELQYDVVSTEKALLESEENVLILEQAKKASRFKTTIIILSLVALLMFGIYLINRLSQKKQQLKLENQQITTNLEDFSEKLKLLEGDLETKTQDLTDFALDITRKNEITAQLVASLKKVEKHLTNKTNEDFKALKSLITSHQQINEDISFFQENIDTINNEFFKSLKTEYPSLTKNELQLCGLIRLNLSIKDIAMMRNVAPKSIEMSRYRLRKKFKLEKGKDLTEFLTDISPATSD